MIELVIRIQSEPRGVCLYFSANKVNETPFELRKMNLITDAIADVAIKEAERLKNETGNSTTVNEEGRDKILKGKTSESLENI